MTIQTDSRITSEMLTDGLNNTFPYDFPIFKGDNGQKGVEVRFMNDLGYDIVDPSLFLVIEDSDNTSGMVQFYVPPVAGKRLLIAGKTPIDQQLDITNASRFNGKSIETNFDKIVSMIQEFISSLDEEIRQRINNNEELRNKLDLMFAQYIAEVDTRFNSKWTEIADYLNATLPMFFCIMRKEINAYATTGLIDVLNNYLENETSLSALIDEYIASLDQDFVINTTYFSGAFEFDPSFVAAGGKYPLNAKLKLSNGDIVRSTVANNTVDPNTDMIGWKKTNLASEIFDLSGKSQQEINDTLSVNVKSFGATGKGLVDDIVAIKSALAFMQTFTNGGSLHFPAGIYNISEPIKITKTGITISGDGLTGAINFTTKEFSGSHILYTANDGQSIVQFGDDSALLYIETVKNIKIGPAPTVTTKPLAALQFNAISEFYLDNVSLTGCTYNLDINSCNIGYVNNYVLASGDYNVRMRADSTVYTSGANASLFFSKGNMWKADKSHIRITASTASILSFSESWAEYAQRVFDIEQTSDVSMSVTVKLDKFSASTSASFAPTDPTYNIANNRFLKAKAFQGGVTGLRVRIDGTDLIAFMQSANHLFEYEKGTNTSVNSYMDESILINPILYGAQLSVFKSDTISSSASLIGKVVANKGYANGVAVPLSDGNTSVGILKSTIGAFDMREGKPFYLPQQSPSNINTVGQLYFDTVVNRPVYTSQFSAIRLPKPLLTTLNDADLTATLDGTGETIVLVNPLTANRAITLPTVGKYNGAKMRVVRQVGSTGAFTMNVGSLKNLSAGQWCDVECNSALNWVLTAFGSL